MQIYRQGTDYITTFYMLRGKKKEEEEKNERSKKETESAQEAMEQI